MDRGPPLSNVSLKKKWLGQKLPQSSWEPLGHAGLEMSALLHGSLSESSGVTFSDFSDVGHPWKG